MIPDSLRGRLTITVPEAGALLGINRDAAYAAVERGEIPALRLGRRICVPVAPLLKLLGVDLESETAGPDDSGPAAA